MPQNTYYLNLDEVRSMEIQGGLRTVIRLADSCQQWRRLAIGSFGLFLVSVILNIALILGR